MRKRKPFISCLGLEVLICFMALFLYPIFSFFKKKITPKATDRRPILLVHGYLHNASVWVYMMHRLAKANFRSIYTINLWPPFHSIDKYIEMVKCKVKKIQQETGCEEVVLIGHSMGGLVVSHVALDLGLPAAITLVSPLRGTPAAYKGIGKNTREMEPNSSFIRKLQEKILRNRSVKFFHVASEVDLIVPATSALPDAHSLGRHFVVSNLGHLSVMFSPLIADQVIAWLNELKPLPPES